MAVVDWRFLDLRVDMPILVSETLGRRLLHLFSGQWMVKTASG